MYRRRYQQRKSPLLKIVFIIVIAGVIFFGYQYQRYQFLIATPVDATNTQETVITIKKGDNIKTIAETLYNKQLLLDRDSFGLYARLNGLDKQIKTGRFPLNPSLNTAGIFEVITSNKTREEVVTIPEGSTIAEIDKILADDSLISSGEFIKAVKDFNFYEKYSFLDKTEQQKLPTPLEGYLFPDTYFVSANEFSSQSFITLLLNTFSKKALPEIQKSNRSVAEVVNVAAMVEKEANRKQDRPIIAGIIWKRLDEKWALGIDATLLYLKDSREITYQDLKNNNPYNTRLNAGLPPGPIANPGLASIEAAAQPKESDYYYYLTSKDGEMIYAKSNEEHSRNKAQYL